MSGGVIWITGLSAAGKTTLATAVIPLLKNHGITTISLDGNLMREVLGEGSMHSKEDRLRIGQSYSRLCRLLSNQDVTVVIATVGMFHDLHRWNRDNLSYYLEVFLDVPIEELRRRDPKGIYRRYFKGEITNVAGLDMLVENPIKPDLHFKYEESRTVQDMADTVFSSYIHLYEGGLT